MAVSKLQGKKVGSFTNESGITAIETFVEQYGNCVYVRATVTKSAGLGTAEVIVGAISGVDLPKTNVRALCGAGTQAYNAWECGYCILDTSGKLSVRLSTSRPTANITLMYAV